MPTRPRIASLFVAIAAPFVLAAALFVPAAAPFVLAAPGRAQEAPRWPADAVLLFVAGWCAPCHAELAEVEALAAAAAPRRLLVVPADRSRATAAMLAGVEARVWRDARALRALWAGELGAGLPFTLVTDGAGRTCAEHRRVLRVRDVAVLAARCPTRSPRNTGERA